MYKVNAASSVKRGRLIREISAFQKMLNGAFIGGYVMFFPFVGVIALAKEIQNDAVTTGVIIMALFGVTAGILIFYSVLKINRLRRLNGFQADKNMELVKNAAENLGWQKAYHNNKFSGFTLYDWLSWDWGKELTIVYNGNELLINCVALGKGSSYSPFHWLPTIRAENKFITELRRLQAANVSSSIQL